MATNVVHNASHLDNNDPKQEPSSERSEASRDEHPIVECANGLVEGQRHGLAMIKDEKLGAEGDTSLTAKSNGGDENEEDALAAEILRSLAASQWRKVRRIL